MSDENRPSELRTHHLPVDSKKPSPPAGSKHATTISRKLSPAGPAGRKKSIPAKRPQEQETDAEAGPLKATSTKGAEKSVIGGARKNVYSPSKMKRMNSAKSLEGHPPVTSGQRKSIAAAAESNKLTSLKSPEHNHPATSGQRKSITSHAASKLTSPKSPERNPPATSGQRKSISAAATSKLTSPKSPERNPGNRKYSSAPAAGSKLTSVKSPEEEIRTSAIASKSAAEHEKSETVNRRKSVSRKASKASGALDVHRSSLSKKNDDDHNKAAAEEADRAGQRKRKRRMNLVPRVLTKQASKFLGTATALIPLSVAERKARAMRSAGHHAEDDEESGHSELDSNQQHCLALVGALAFTLVLLIALTLAIYFWRPSPEDVKVACTTAKCLEARRFMDSLLDSSKDKCQDFYSYVCNRWELKGSSFERDMEDELIATLHEKLKEGVAAVDQQGTHVMAQVYRGCHTYVSTKERLGMTLSITEDVVMSGRMRRANSFAEVVKLVARASLEIGLNTVLTLRMEAAPEGRNRLRISPGKSILRKLDVGNYDDLRRTLEATLEWLPNVYTRDSVAETIESDQIVEAALQPRYYGGSEALVDNQAGALAQFVNGMAPSVGAEAWRQAVNSALPPHLKIDQHAIVIADAPAAFRVAFVALSSAGLEKTRFYLGANLDAEVAYLETSKESLSAAGASQAARFCLELCRRIRSLSWHELVRNLIYNQEIIDTANTVKEMFASLARAVKDKSVLTWLPNDARKEAHRVAATIQVDVIQANAISDVTIDMSHFSAPPMDNPRAFVFGFLDVIKADNKMLLGLPPTHRDVVLQRVEPYGPISYISELGSVLVPSLYLRHPYFYGSDVPLYFNYGTVGVLLATVIAQAIIKEPDRAAVATDKPATSTPSRAPKSWWTDEMREKRNRSISCLQELRQRLGSATSPDNSSMSTPDEDATLFAWASGLQLAYHTMRKRFEEVAGEETGYWHQAQRTFFVRSCMLWCSSVGAKGPLSAREHCLLPLHDSAEFADVYSCFVQTDYVQGKCSV